MSVEDVVRAIDHAKRMISDHPSLVKYEAYNRYITIDPIIRALGWKTENPNECMVEWPRGKKRVLWVDYAFFDLDQHDNNPIMIIEAKGLGRVASRPETQLSKYMQGRRAAELRRGAVTDGNFWHIYDLTALGTWETKHINTVKICGGSARGKARLLNSYLSKRALQRLFD